MPARAAPRGELTRVAEADVAKARQWYERREAGLGDRFVGHVEQAVERIAENPYIYQPVIEDVRRANVPRYP